MTRRTVEDQIRDLEAKIVNIKERAARNHAKANPAVKHMSQALKSIDKALNATDDSALRKALDEGRATVASCLGLCGITPRVPKPSLAPRRGVGEGGMPAAKKVLAFLEVSPGSSSEQITAALGTDAASLRPRLRELMEKGQIHTKGERRGRRYYPANVALAVAGE